MFVNPIMSLLNPLSNLYYSQWTLDTGTPDTLWWLRCCWRAHGTVLRCRTSPRKRCIQHSSCQVPQSANEGARLGPVMSMEESYNFHIPGYSMMMTNFDSTLINIITQFSVENNNGFWKGVTSTFNYWFSSWCGASKQRPPEPIKWAVMFFWGAPSRLPSAPAFIQQRVGPSRVSHLRHPSQF